MGKLRFCGRQWLSRLSFRSIALARRRAHKGKLGAELSVDQGREAARMCALNMLPHLREACGGNPDRVVRCVEIGGFVNATPELTEHPLVLNRASEFLVEVFGEAGRHTRFAVGVASLPFNFAVEVKGIFEIH
jgi:enamine deaminase RidA (YjgF/YER057c/UK114 family)